MANPWMANPMTVDNSPLLKRFTFQERVVHWAVALSFVYLALTGLALWSPQLYWLAGVFGGGETVRAAHPWVGVFFCVVLALMFGNWARFMLIDRDDRRWLAMAHRYAVGKTAGMPEPGRFNAGQKVMFWMQCLMAVLMLASGLVLWYPEVTSRGLRLAAIVIHPASAVISICGIIVHFYMATFATPGSLRGMIEGEVDADWARHHHPKWYRETTGDA